MQAVQLRCNGDAANVSLTAVDKLMTATQKILDAEGVGGDARTWARQHGFNVDDPPRPQPITQNDIKPGLEGNWRHAGGGGTAGTSHAVSNAGWHGGGAEGGASGGAAAPAEPAALGGNWRMTGHVPGGPPQAPTPGVTSPGGGGPVSTGLAGVHGGSMPMAPTGLGQGAPPNLAQSFANGVVTGQPAGAGAQGLSSSAINAVESGAPAAPQAAPPAGAPATGPTIPSTGTFIPTSTPVDAPSPAAPAPPTTGAPTPVAPVMSGGSWSGAASPVAGTPSAPAGPLPAYGSDLRASVAGPPAVSSVPTGPVSGAPVAPSPSSSPSGGGALVSPVERAASGGAAGQAGASSSTTVGSSAMSAASGAAAGAASSRAAEQQRLQRLVDAVARQEPRVSWAAGLRDDRITSLLVTDLAGGWIPPHVRLPVHVTLLEPAARRRDASVVDLLGAVVVAAAHEHNTYVAEPGAEAPTLSGDRPARSAAPRVDELGPALVEAVRRRDGLPRIAQAVAAPAVRNTGVLENEAELLRSCIVEIQNSVLTAYPNHDQAAVGDWMLLAAIEAMIDGHEYLANYHMSWFDATNHQPGAA